MFLRFTHAVSLLSVTVNSERLDATEHFLDWYLFTYTLSVFFKHLPTSPTLLPSAPPTCASPPRYCLPLPALFSGRSVSGCGVGWDGLMAPRLSFILLLTSCCSPSSSLTFSLHMLCSKGWAPEMCSLPE